MNTIWNEQEILWLVEEQNRYFKTGVTLPVAWRKDMLRKLKHSVQLHRAEIETALYADLGRSAGEAFLCDIGPLIMEINETLRGVDHWARTEHHFSGWACFPSMVTKVHKMPYGTVLIISPYNFPILLSLGVLVAAIAGGNTAVIKASSKSPCSTTVLEKIVSDVFPREYVCVVSGGHEVADLCLDCRFDKIFYTGSPKVGAHVLAKAAKHLTPVALELGGENGNWCIVRRDADLKDAARKIAFFKLCNSGQICININQVAVAQEVADQFLEELKKAYRKQIGDALSNEEYPHLITSQAYEKCEKECALYADRVVFGGKGNAEEKKFEPTILYPVGIEEEIVRHELFSPLLPIVPFRDEEADSVLRTIGEREHGLALYLFTKDLRWANRVMAAQQYGGGGINEVCLHLTVKGVPFNGTGHSGMGAYHGEWGFREFTHPSTVLIGKTRGNLSLREHPYTRCKEKLLELFER